MKLILLVLCFCAYSLGIPFPEENLNREFIAFRKNADKLHLERQLKILKLFKHIDQPSFYEEHLRIADSYSVEDNLDAYTPNYAVADFLRYSYRGLLPRNEIFSVFNEEHLQQAIVVFKLFHHSKDFDSLYKTAVWARNHLNQGLFLYAFSVAVLHHPATYGILLPPIYEVYPFYFYNGDVISKAQKVKQENGCYSSCNTFHGPSFIIEANYSGKNLNVHSEQSLSYYMEDLGINAFYYYYNLYRPFWLNQEEVYFNSFNRGEEFYYFYQQFLARFYLERLSNNYGKIEAYDYEKPLRNGYVPHMVYSNGLPFPQRPKMVKLDNDYFNEAEDHCGYDYQKVVDQERWIREKLDHSYNKNDAGFNNFCKIMENNSVFSDSHQENFQISSRHLLGCSKKPSSQYQTVPSSLEHFETSMRDPIFYQLSKRMDKYFQKYKQHLPRYNYTDLIFHGVNIESIQANKLFTYFDIYTSHISNAAQVNVHEYIADPIQIKTRLSRLNHKPFSYTIKVSSTKQTEGIVRVFIGPKYDEHEKAIDINENRLNFVEFDTFKATLDNGENVIHRNSEDTYFSDDYMDQKTLIHKLNVALGGEEKFPVYGNEVHYTFPRRFLLPKGKRNGQTYQIFAIISPYIEPNHRQQQWQKDKQQQHQQNYQLQYDIKDEKLRYYYPIVGLGVQKLDSYSLGYPFDRPIDTYHFNVPNSKFEDIIIYHDDLN